MIKSIRISNDSGDSVTLETDKKDSFSTLRLEASAWDSVVVYLTLEEARQIRDFLNEAYPV